MNAINRFYTGLSNEKIISTTGSRYCKIQVSGTGVCDITVEGRIDKEGDFAPQLIIKDENFDLIDRIISPGIYTINCEGYYDFNIKVNTIAATLKVVAETIVF